MRSSFSETDLRKLTDEQITKRIAEETEDREVARVHYSSRGVGYLNPLEIISSRRAKSIIDASYTALKDKTKAQK